MSILGEAFPIDVFISYGWHDVRGLGLSGFTEWAGHFQKELQNELDAFYDAPTNVFIDKRTINPHRQIDPQLEKHARAAAVFIPLISHHYPKSDYCKKELQWWRSAQVERGLDEEGRLAIVRIWGGAPDDDPGWEKLWSERNFKSRGYHFHSLENAQHHPQPFGWSEKLCDRIQCPEFHDAVMDLCTYLKIEFDELKNYLDEQKRMEAERLAAAGRELKIYLFSALAEVSHWSAIADIFGRTPPGENARIVFGAPNEYARTFQERIDDAQQRMQVIRDCDAVMIVAPDNDQHLCNLAIYGFDLAKNALASTGRAGSPLPIIIVDPVRDPNRKSSRKEIVSWPRIGWMELDAPDLAKATASFIRENTR